MSNTATNLFSPLAQKWLESICLDDIRIPSTSIVQARVDGGKVDAAYPETPEPDLVLVFPTAERLRDYVYQFSESCHPL
jgi:hypothetical protein